jgi:hypothetical protein
MTNLNHDQITETVLKGVEIASKILNIKEPEVYFNPHTDFSNPNVSSMYLKSRNAIVFNDKWLDSANELEILTTCFHETRHAYQHFCIQSNSREDQETINIWKREIENYIRATNTNNPIYDESYLLQAVEIDAIAFAYYHMKDLFYVQVKIPESIIDKVETQLNIIKEKTIA